MGLRDPRNGGRWDYVRCAINFDGAANANANSRYWYITDHWSDERVYEIGVPELGLDKTQDWKFGEESDNYTECPFLEKCTFQCSAYRNYETASDEFDYQYMDGLTTINFYYGVYYGEDMLIQGGIDWTNFQMPLANATALSATAIAAFATILFTF